MQKHVQSRNALKGLYQRLRRAPLMVYAAAADYCCFVALIPALILLMSLVRFLPLSQRELQELLRQILPQAAYRVLGPLAITTSQLNGAVTLSFLLTAYSASGAMRALMRCLDAVYGVKRRDRLPLYFFRAVVYMLLFLLVLALSLLLLVLSERVCGFLPQDCLTRRLLSSAGPLRFFLALGILALAFLLLYRWVPAGEHRMACQWPGAVFSALSWASFSWLFSLYIKVSHRFGAYGTLGAVLITMMWMYYCLLLFLVGGCINAWLEEREERKTEI